MTKLALVEIQGPFWTLTAVAPAFGLQNVAKKLGLQEDRLLPIRTLLADAAVPEDDAQNWRRPRLMSMHLIAGGSGDYHLNGQSIIMTLPQKFEVDDPEFRTVDIATGDLSLAAFQHVTVEPILDGDEVWPKNNQVPAFRLVAGAIDIAGTPNKFNFLGPLDVTGKNVVIRLTPDGVELERQAPFPGVDNLKPNDPGIDGRFLLHSASGEMRLRLLTDRQDVRLDKWRDVWFSVTAKDDIASRIIAGVKVEGRRDVRPPSFVWHVAVKSGGIQPLKRSVDIPAADLEVRLLSPRTTRGIDGEVTLDPDHYTLSALKDAEIPPQIAVPWKEKEVPVVLIAQLKPSAGASKTEPATTTRLRFDITPAVSNIVLKSAGKGRVAHRCAHDEVKLAATLRRAYGLDDLLPGVADPDRPMLAAFAPLDDGWLQLPVPNMPPPDVNKDDIDIPDTQTVSNVLTGYLRFAQTGNAPAVLSAFGGTFDVSEAPWLITVEGAKGAAFIVGIQPARLGATLLQAAASFDDPQLSTRGLCWFSADRPDAFEALPRLGAGAQAYFDVPLDTYDIEKQTAVQFTIRELAIGVEAEPREQPCVVSRTALSVEVAFDSDSPTGWQTISDVGRLALEKARDVLTGKPSAAATTLPPLPPVRWQRHPNMPLAAEMPMTRGAAASVRPLESRDMVPFVIAVDAPAKKKPSRWFRLTWKNAEVFPRLTGVDSDDPVDVSPAFRWPWPQAASAENGVALAAFGVPGAELVFPVPFNSPEGDPWQDLRFALRYDIPALDEAFATATLPPQPVEKAPREEREVPPAVPVPLAQDWDTMRRFWEEQNRRHQVARVAHSYLVAPAKIGSAKSIADLIDGLTWTTDVNFAAAAKSDELPYGAAIVGNAAQPLKGNAALLGIDQVFSIKSNELKPDEAGPVKVFGYAPASYKDADEFLMDSRLSGVKPAKSVNGFLWRAIRDRNTPVTGLATMRQDIAASEFFTFWFKDLPVDKTGTFTPIADGFIDFNAWQDGNLPRSGFEWRLIPAKRADEVFRLGRDLVPFFGFLLEPLRLRSCVLKMSGGEPAGVQSVSIDARLHLGPLQKISAQDHNVITLQLLDDGAGGLTIADLTAPNVEFVLHPNDAKGSMSRVRLTSEVKWRKAQPGKPAGLDLDFKTASLFVTMFGEERLLERPVIAASDGSVTAVWPETEFPEPELLPLKGTLVVQKVVLTVTNNETVTLTLDRRLYLMPRAAASANKLTSASPIRVRLEGDAVAEVKILGVKAPVTSDKGEKLIEIKELGGAFTLRTKNAAPIAGQSLFPGFPIDGKLTFGFAARIAPMVSGVSDLQAGRFEAEIVVTTKAKGAVKLDRIIFRGERGRRLEENSVWRGDIRFDGRIDVTNAIAWPGLREGKPLDAVIPFPGNAANGRNPVTFDQVSYVDAVSYTLDGHALPFDLASRLGDDKTVWTLPVIAKHTITRSDGVAIGSFTGVETIAIGAAKAVVPPPNIDKDPLSFGPRRATTVVKGDDSGKTEPGMIENRIGRIGTVLSGDLGLSFRRAFWPAEDTDRPGFFVAGGFAGLLTSDESQESAPLLRLPLLAPLDTQTLTIGQKSDGQAIDVAWPDSRAALEIIATMRSAVAPSSTSDTAIRTALLAGSRDLQDIAAINADATVAAVMAEQSFAVSRGNPDLDTTPFFIGAVVSLARSLTRLNPSRQPTVLSLIAGYGIDDDQGRHSLAAAVVTRNLDGDSVGKRAQTPPELVTIGEDLVTHPWTGPDVAALGDVVPVALIAGPAFVDHVQPRAVLLRTVQGEQAHFDAPPLPKPFDRPRAAAPIVEKQRSFADAGRGYALKPGNDELRWLQAPEDVEMMPFRDVDVIGDKSGLAGLSRIIAMPAHAANVAGDPVEPDAGETNDPVRNSIVWIAQTRSPVYLPLDLSSVKAPPVPWLTPGTPRPRNPDADSMAEALKRIDVGIGKNGKVEDLQPLLPSAATIASVGDRAGISLARVTRFETALSNLAAFDGINGRFGRPAQGGAWSVRTERTPRPGVLPKNQGKDGKDEERDRRPCASPIIFDRNVTAIAASADRVSGEANANIGAWTVTFVAAQDWFGRITDSWDGTLKLHVEIDVKAATSPGDVRETLQQLLFPGTSGKPLNASAALVIGNVTIPFLRIHFGPSGKFEPRDGVQRGVTTIVLDARPGDPSPSAGAALRAIADALADDVLPPVQVELVVHPGENPKTTLPTPVELSSKTQGLAEGDVRAPVTLRMPLAPVIRSRGALPLAPASLLFIDRSYDATLSSAPAQFGALLQKPVSVPPLTPERGGMTLTLYADRSRVNRKASITFMIDLAFEKKLDAFARQQLEALGKHPDGDLVKDSITGTFLLGVKVIPRTGLSRDLVLGKAEVTLAKVYELPLSSLTEVGGKPAVLAAGDTLQLTVTENKDARVQVTVFGASSNSQFKITQLDDKEASRTLNLILTDEPVAEPPSALYAALVRRKRGEKDIVLSLPLYAQSPLPWRVDLRDPKNDFRAGLMRRAAMFIWNLSRPNAERVEQKTSIFIVKTDRNGQTFLPDSAELFESPRLLKLQES